MNKKTKIREFVNSLKLLELSTLNLALVIKTMHGAEYDKENITPHPDAGPLPSFEESFADVLTNISECIRTNDEDNSLKHQVVELLRYLPLIQKELNGPSLNYFLSDHLPENLFRRLYEAVGLNVEEIQYAPYDGSVL